MEIKELINISVYNDHLETYPLGQWNSEIEHWTHRRMDDIARRDCINPPTGIALRDVLKSFYGELNGQEMQIIRWNPEKVIE